MSYSKLSLAVPPSQADERLRAFFNDLLEIRTRHSIPDVHVIVQQNVLTDKGETQGLATIHFGDQRNALSMVSYAFGHAQGESRKLILSARAQGMKQGAEVALREVNKMKDDLFGDEN